MIDAQHGIDTSDSMPLFHNNSSAILPVSAKQLIVQKCSVHRAVELNEQWHSRLPHIHWSNVVRASPSICFIAEYDNIAYASAIWSAPCARLLNGRHWLELRRLAICKNAPKNTASRMLSIMRKVIVRELPDIVNLISYQDTEVHLGTIYKASGWTPTVRNECGDWKRANRVRNTAQSLAPKVRWEYQLSQQTKQKGASHEG